MLGSAKSELGSSLDCRTLPSANDTHERTTNQLRAGTSPAPLRPLPGGGAHSFCPSVVLYYAAIDQGPARWEAPEGALAGGHRHLGPRDGRANLVFVFAHRRTGPGY